MPLKRNGSALDGVTLCGNALAAVQYNGTEVWSSGPIDPGACVMFYGPSAFSLSTPNAAATWDAIMEYSTDNETWTEWDGSSAISAVSVGGKYVLYLRGTENTTISSIGDAIQLQGDGVRVVGDALNLMEYLDFSLIVFDSGAYRNVSWITEMNIPNGVGITGNRTFMGCTGLVSMKVNTNWTSAVASFCDGCTALETVELPATITSFGQNAFRNCTSLKTMTLLSANPPTLGSNALQNVPADCAIYVLAASVAAYQAASGWSDRAAYIQAKP